MAKSLDHVLQPDGTYKWEEVELVHSTAPVEACLHPNQKQLRKKLLKRKLLAHYLTNSWQSKKK